MKLPFTGPAIDHEQVVAAIAAAERRTSGEIRVIVARGQAPEPVALAKKHFDRLGMSQTEARNGVLILVAPRSHTCAIIGDSGIHAKCGDAFWREIADAMTVHFRRGDLTAGIVFAVDRVAEPLAEHFPIKSDDRNELPDEIEEA